VLHSIPYTIYFQFSTLFVMLCKPDEQIFTPHDRFHTFIQNKNTYISYGATHLETSHMPLCATYNIVIYYTAEAHRDCNYIPGDCDLFVSWTCWVGVCWPGGSADRSSCRHRWTTPSRCWLTTPPAAWRRRFGSRLHGQWPSLAYRHMEISSKSLFLHNIHCP
jgi:hypothetical protein